MKVVVLGGSGQIGSSLIDFLSRKNIEVVSIDIEQDSVYDLRIRHISWVDEIRSADFVFFLAFDVGGSRYLQRHEQTKAFLDNNILIMFNVFSVLEEYGKAFVFASTQMSNMNFSTYGVLKRIGEFYTRVLGGLSCRFWNVYGHENSPEKNHVISDFISMAKETQFIHMRTNGQEVRQFLFVEDCNGALFSLMENYDALDKKEPYDISSFEWNSILDVATIISESTSATIIRGTSADTVQLDSKNEPNSRILSYWKPTTSLRDGINSLIKQTDLNEKR